MKEEINKLKEGINKQIEDKLNDFLQEEFNFISLSTNKINHRKFLSEEEIDIIKKELDYLYKNRISIDTDIKEYGIKNKSIKKLYKKIEDVYNKQEDIISDLEYKISKQKILLFSSNTIDNGIVEKYRNITKKEVGVFIIDNEICRNKIIATFADNIVVATDSSSDEIKVGFGILFLDEFYEIVDYSHYVKDVIEFEKD